MRPPRSAALLRMRLMEDNLDLRLAHELHDLVPVKYV